MFFRMTTESYQWCARGWRWFFTFHFKNWKKIDKDLIIFRALSIILLLAYCLIDTIMYASTATEKSDVLKFLHGSRYLALEILVIIYASGVAAFGTSVEIYPLFLYVIANCILVVRNCGGSSMTRAAIVWVFKVFFLFLAVELCYWNFRKLVDYENRFNSSARVMLRQALMFSITMLFLSSPGLETLYFAINKSLPHSCIYEISTCGIIDLYVPSFSYDNDKCSDTLKAYVSGREQLRVLRNFMLLNGVSYSIFNVNFLGIHRGAKHFQLRIVLVLLFVALFTSVLISNVNPFYFIHKCQLTYSIIECIIFVILLSLLSYNLHHLRRSPPSVPSAKQLELTNMAIPEEALVIVTETPATIRANRVCSAENMPMERLPKIRP